MAADPQTTRAADPADTPANDDKPEKAPKGPKASNRDALIAKARDRELKRQEDVRKAVADGAGELEKLGGPLLDPGLGR